MAAPGKFKSENRRQSNPVLSNIEILFPCFSTKFQRRLHFQQFNVNLFQEWRFPLSKILNMWYPVFPNRIIFAFLTTYLTSRTRHFELTFCRRKLSFRLNVNFWGDYRHLNRYPPKWYVKWFWLEQLRLKKKQTTVLPVLVKTSADQWDYGRVLLGLFRNRNTWNRRYLCSFGSYFVFGMNGISFRSFCSR